MSSKVPSNAMYSTVVAILSPGPTSSLGEVSLCILGSLISTIALIILIAQHSGEAYVAFEVWYKMYLN